MSVSICHNNQKIPVLDLTNITVTSELDLCAAFYSSNLCSSETQKTCMVEKNPLSNKSQLHHISDSDTSDDEINPCLCTSVEERHYSIIPGSSQATQTALSHTRAQCNLTVERGPPRQPRIRQLPQDKAEEKSTQTKPNKPSK